MIAARDSIFELNVMMPLIAHNLLTSIDLLTKGIAAFADKCVTGIEADEQRCKEMIEQSLAMCTALAPVIGYDRAAELAKQAYSSGRTIREVATEAQVLPEEELERLLDPASMTRPKQNG
jgi:fumarate hydratase class II